MKVRQTISSDVFAIPLFAFRVLAYLASQLYLQLYQGNKYEKILDLQFYDFFCLVLVCLRDVFACINSYTGQYANQYADQRPYSYPYSHTG